jgi:zinc protease
VRTLLPGISVRDIAAEARDYFAAGDLRIFISAPETETIPPEKRFTDLVKESAKMKVDKPEAAGPAGELLDAAPIPGAISAESTDPETGAVLWTLENGAKVILRETKNRNNEIVLSAMARGGLTGVPEEDLVSARLAPEMTEASGLGPYSRPELIKKLADKQVSLSFWTSDAYRGFQGSGGSGDIKTLFEMLYLSFTRPRIDDEAAAVLLDQYRTVLDRRGDDPNTVFGDEITKTVTSGSIWYKPLEISDLGRADSGKALAFLRRALNPSDYTFVFVGNINTAEMRALAETYLASIPRGAAWNKWTDSGIVRPGKITNTVYKGREDRSTVYLGWYEDAPWSEESSITAQVLTEYLDIKMTEEIREKLRGVYSISVGISSSPAPRGERSMQVSFACDPHRVEELISACIDLLQRTASQPIDGDVFAKSVEALRKEWEASIQSNSYIARSYANSSVLLETPLSRLDKRPALFGTVRPAAIQELLRELLPGGPARIVLYPEY